MTGAARLAFSSIRDLHAPLFVFAYVKTLFVALLAMVFVPGPGARLHEYGVSLRLPVPWHGLLFGPRELGPNSAVELQLATFPFPRSRALHYMWAIGRPLHAHDLHVVIVDYGRTHRTRPPVSWTKRLPLQIRLRDVDGAFEGVQPHHGAASRIFLIGHHQVQVWVEFGVKHPGEEAIATVNDLLRTIQFAKKR